MMTRRFENWPILLSEYLTAARGRAFEWGQHDCIMFPAGIINALCGLDLAADLRGTYNTQEGAQALLDADFGGAISGVFYHYLGQPIDYPLKAQRGDIVMADIRGNATGGIVDDTGRRAAFITIDRGITYLPLSNRMIVWGYG